MAKRKGDGGPRKTRRAGRDKGAGGLRLVPPAACGQTPYTPGDLAPPTHVRAGFPSPAEDYIEGRLDLNRHLIKHPAATFFVRVAGDSMIDAGIHPGDILVVDRAVAPESGDVVIATVCGELVVKRLRVEGDEIWLDSEHSSLAPFKAEPEHAVEVWGVVTFTIHAMEGK